MKQKPAIRTTLGDLVAVLTAEVTPFVQTEKERNTLVARILSDLLTTRRVGTDKYYRVVSS